MPRIEQIKAMLQENPRDPFLLFALGMEHFSSKQYERALESFDHVIEVAPDNDAAYMQKARALIELGRTDAAKQALTAGMEAAQHSGDRHGYEKMQEMYDLINSE